MGGPQIETLPDRMIGLHVGSYMVAINFEGITHKLNTGCSNITDTTLNSYNSVNFGPWTWNFNQLILRHIHFHSNSFWKSIENHWLKIFYQLRSPSGKRNWECGLSCSQSKQYWCCKQEQPFCFIASLTAHFVMVGLVQIRYTEHHKVVNEVGQTCLHIAHS